MRANLTTVPSSLEAMASQFLTFAWDLTVSPALGLQHFLSLPVKRKEYTNVNIGSLPSIKILGVKIQNTPEFLKGNMEGAYTVTYA